MQFKVRNKTGLILNQVIARDRREERLIMKFVKQIRNDLTGVRAVRSPPQRAKIKHDGYELVVKSLRVHIGKESAISCKKGCFNCCSLRVAVQPDEAALLLEKADQMNIDLGRIERQAKAMEGHEQDEEFWYQMPLEDRWCAFLNRENGECQVYDDRPLTCRDMVVLSPPENCTAETPGAHVEFLAEPYSALFCDLTMEELGPQDTNIDLATAIMRVKGET